MKKFVKVMFDLTSGADKGFKYKIGEVNVASNWNPDAKNGKDFGGFNYCSEECILRWLHRGDTIYDVTIPDDAENVCGCDCTQCDVCIHPTGCVIYERIRD